jgi:hypothetical protein
MRSDSTLTSPPEVDQQFEEKDRRALNDLAPFSRDRLYGRGKPQWQGQAASRLAQVSPIRRDPIRRNGLLRILHSDMPRTNLNVQVVL